MVFVGGFWCALGATLVPGFNAYGAYAIGPGQATTTMDNSGNPLGLHSPAFNSSFAFFLLFMSQLTFLIEVCHDPFADVALAMISVIFLICSLRTNIVFFVIFLSFVLAFSCLAGAYWNLALAFENAANIGAAATAAKLLKVGNLKRRLSKALIHNIGLRWMLLCRLHCRMVDFFRYHACFPRFSIPDSSG